MFKQWLYLLPLTIALFLINIDVIAETIDYPEASAIILGTGFDVTRNHSRGTAVVGGNVKTIISNPGQSVHYSMEKIEDVKMLARSIRASARASYSGFWSATAKADMVTNHTFNQYSLYLLLKIQVMKNEQVLTNPQLSDEAKILIDKFGVAQFFRVYGENYIVSVSTGGEYFGLFEIVTYSDDDKSKLSTSLSGSGYGYSGSFSVAKSINKLSTHHEVRVSEIWRGGKNLRPAINPDQMISNAQSFPEKVNEAPVPIKVTIRRYQNLPSFVLKSLEKFDDLELRKQYEILIDEIVRYRRLKNNIEYIIEKPEQFIIPYFPILPPKSASESRDIKNMKDLLKSTKTILRDLDYLALEIGQSQAEKNNNTKIDMSRGDQYAKKKIAELTEKIRMEEIKKMTESISKLSYENYFKKTIKRLPNRHKAYIPGMKKEIRMETISRIATSRVMTADKKERNDRDLDGEESAPVRVQLECKVADATDVPDWLPEKHKKELLKNTKGKHLYVFARLILSESQPNWTVLDGYFFKKVYSAPEGLSILGVEGGDGLIDESDGESHKHTPRTFSGSGGGLVKSAMILSDVDGDDLGRTYAESIMLNPVTVIFQHDDGDLE